MPFAPRRALGKTGFVATAVGAGDLADRALGVDACARTLRRALDAGVNVVDTAPSYEDGLSEEIVGRAVAGVRDSVFVIDKIDHPLEPIAPQVEASIARLGFEPDAFVFHGLRAWSPAFAGGPMEELAREVERGRCRFRGISSHHPDALRGAIRSGTCDIVMFALGPLADASYVDEILPLARERRVGTVCFKAFGAGKLVGATEGYGRPLPPGALASAAPLLSVEECVHAIMTHDPDVALLGLSTPAEQDAAFAAARSFTPLAPPRLADIRRRALEAAHGKGTMWWNPE